MPSFIQVPSSPSELDHFSDGSKAFSGIGHLYEQPLPMTQQQLQPQQQQQQCSQTCCETQMLYESESNLSQLQDTNANNII